MSERKTIYLCLAHMSEEGWEQKYVKEAFDTNWVVPMGPNVYTFEQNLADFSNANLDGSKLDRKVVCLSAGTAAVHLALIACGVQLGDEVCVQSFTFCASSHPITYLGAKPVFIDSEKETWNMDPELLEKAIIDRKEKTGKYPKAIIPVALYGMPYDCERIMVIADKYGIPVIEDAAEGMGSRYNGQVLGPFGRFGVLSFNGNKTITTGGGGMMLFNDEELGAYAKHITTQAKVPHRWEFRHDHIGYNYRMPNINAALGCAQLENLDVYIAGKRAVAAAYAEFFKNVDDIEFFNEPENCFSNYWLNVVILKDKEAQLDFLQQTNDNKVMTRPIWELMTRLPMFEHCENDGLKNTIWFADRVVNIPSSVRL